MTNMYLDIETVPLPQSKRAFSKPILENMPEGTAKDEEKRKARQRENYDKAINSWMIGESAALKAETGMVAAVGFTADPELNFNSVINSKATAAGEKSVLKNMWPVINGLYKEQGSLFVGHYLVTFDIPFLVRRSFIQGVKVPRWVLIDLNQYRPKVFQDTRLTWTFGNKQEHIKLEYLGYVFDIPVKTGKVTGESFYRYWLPGIGQDQKACLEYLKEDVMILPKLWAKMNP